MRSSKKKNAVKKQFKHTFSLSKKRNSDRALTHHAKREYKSKSAGVFEAGSQGGSGAESH